MGKDIHRVGRTARAGAQGRALMFLLPTESNFLTYLTAAKVPLNEYEFVESKLASIPCFVFLSFITIIPL